MDKKLESIRERANKALSKFFNKFNHIKILDPENYKNFRSKLTFYCEKHDHTYTKSFETCLYSVGGGCKYCIKEHRTIYKEKPRIQLVTNKFKDRFDIIDGRYFRCKKHPNIKIEIQPDQLYKEHLCPYCLKEKQSLSLDEIKQRIYDKFGDKIKLLTEKNLSVDSKVKVYCNVHNLDYEVNLGDLLYQNTNCCPQGFYEFKQKVKQKDTEYFINRAKKKFGNRFDYSKVDYRSYDNDPVIIKCNEHNIEFEIVPSYHMNSLSGGCPKCKQISTSSAEKEIMSLLDQYNIKYISGDRKLLKGKEIDILIPDYKLAIEYNGILFHSFGRSYPNNYEELDSKYHLRKTIECEQQGYQLLHINEDEWINSTKKEIWESMILYKVNVVQNKYYARKLEIKELDNKDIRNFLDENHLQGYIPSKINLGLFNGNELVAVMTFSKPRFNKNYDYELLRYSVKKYSSCVGCFSRLLKYFIKRYNPKSIITYADRRYSQGKVYEKNGFVKLRETPPSYRYIDKDGSIYSRFQFQKHKLKDVLKKYDENLSEIDNMIENNYRIMYDCGNLVYKLDLYKGE